MSSQPKHKRHSLPNPLRNDVTSFLCIIVLKVAKVPIFLSSLINFDHNCGPRNLRECFPLVTVLNRGKTKSAFLRLYLLLLVFSSLILKISAVWFIVNLFFTLNTKMSISCNLLFCKVLNLALLKSNQVILFYLQHLFSTYHQFGCFYYFLFNFFYQVLKE